MAQLLDRIPLRAGECTVIAAPLFHGTGLSQFIMSVALGSTVVVRRRFDAEATLAAVEKHRGTALILVPTMLRRLVALGLGRVGRFDLSTLRIIMVAGAALSPELGNQAMALFGDVLHNMYGGTEVSIATVALPADWRAAPGTVGHPPVGCRVALLDGQGTEITRPFVTGRIFVANDLTFDGYTDRQHKEIVDGMVATGDLGHVDDGGRLFVDGREDDMIVSGGENVYPIEVEHVLVEHADVAEAAVVGVADEEFGQRLVAYIVPASDAVPDRDALASHVRSNLARHKVPREFVFVDALPHNSTGKLARRQLAELG